MFEVDYGSNSRKTTRQYGFDPLDGLRRQRGATNRWHLLVQDECRNVDYFRNPHRFALGWAHLSSPGNERRNPRRHLERHRKVSRSRPVAGKCTPEQACAVPADLRQTHCRDAGTAQACFGLRAWRPMGRRPGAVVALENGHHLYQPHDPGDPGHDAQLDPWKSDKGIQGSN